MTRREAIEMVKRILVFREDPGVHAGAKEKVTDVMLHTLVLRLGRRSLDGVPLKTAVDMAVRRIERRMAKAGGGRQ